MKNKQLTLREKVEALFADRSVTDYRIAKETGISLSPVQDLRNGTSKMDNIRLANAEKYASMYDRIHGNVK